VNPERCGLTREVLDLFGRRATKRPTGGPTTDPAPRLPSRNGAHSCRRRHTLAEAADAPRQLPRSEPPRRLEAPSPPTVAVRTTSPEIDHEGSTGRIHPIGDDSLHTAHTGQLMDKTASANGWSRGHDHTRHACDGSSGPGGPIGLHARGFSLARTQLAHGATPPDVTLCIDDGQHVVVHVQRHADARAYRRVVGRHGERAAVWLTAVV
jgi:hypothetical protein